MINIDKIEKCTRGNRNVLCKAPEYHKKVMLLLKVE